MSIERRDENWVEAGPATDEFINTLRDGMSGTPIASLILRIDAEVRARKAAEAAASAEARAVDEKQRSIEALEAELAEAKARVGTFKRQRDAEIDRVRELDDELAEAKADAEGVRESLNRCLEAMQKFDVTNYDDYGGPHLAEGIEKMGRELAEAREQVEHYREKADVNLNLCQNFIEQGAQKKALAKEAEKKVKTLHARCKQHEQTISDYHADRRRSAEHGKRREKRIAELEEAEDALADSIVNNGLQYFADDGTNDPASPMECLDYAGRELKHLRAKNVTLTEQVKAAEKKLSAQLSAERDEQKSVGYYTERIVELEDTIAEWKEWHRSLADVVGLDFYERKSTQTAVEKLKTERGKLVNALGSIRGMHIIDPQDGVIMERLMNLVEETLREVR